MAKKKPPVVRDWVVIRTVRERFEVYGVATKQEAINLAENPSRVECIKEEVFELRSDPQPLPARRKGGPKKGVS